MNNLNNMGTNLSTILSSINVHEIELAAAIVKASQQRESNLEVDIAALRSLISSGEIVNHLEDILGSIFPGVGFDNNKDNGHILHRRIFWGSLREVINNMRKDGLIKEFGSDIFIVNADHIYALSVEEYKAMSIYYISFILNNSHNIK